MYRQDLQKEITDSKVKTALIIGQEFELAQHIFAEMSERHQGYGRNRKKENVLLRMAFSNALRMYSSLTVETIGLIVGKHHSTIVHYTKNHESYIKYKDYRDIFTICAVSLEGAGFPKRKVNTKTWLGTEEALEGSRAVRDGIDELNREINELQKKVAKIKNRNNELTKHIHRANSVLKVFEKSPIPIELLNID